MLIRNHNQLNGWIFNHSSHKGAGMKIIRKPLDPIATRISAGGIEGKNYIVYRGDVKEVKKILQEALTKLNTMDKEPEIDYSEFGGF